MYCLTAVGCYFEKYFALSPQNSFFIFTGATQFVSCFIAYVISRSIHHVVELRNCVCPFRMIDKATEETAVDTQRLIQCPDNDVQDEIIKERRTKSADLLKKELQKHGKSGTREYLAKVRTNLLWFEKMSKRYCYPVILNWHVYSVKKKNTSM